MKSDVGDDKDEEDENILQCIISSLFNDNEKEDEYACNEDGVGIPASDAVPVEDLQGQM